MAKEWFEHVPVLPLLVAQMLSLVVELASPVHLYRLLLLSRIERFFFGLVVNLS